jgi:hypothetical protein
MSNHYYEAPDETPLQAKVRDLCEARGFDRKAPGRVAAVLLEEEAELRRAEHEAAIEAFYEEERELDELDRIYWAQQAAREPRT